MIPSLLALLFLSCGYVAGHLPSGTTAAEGVGDIRLPEGFRVELWADEIEGARSMALSPSGILYVGTRTKDKVYAIVPDGRSRRVVVVAQGLTSPNGVAWRDGALYVAEISRVIRFDDIDRTYASKPSYTVVNDQFPTDKAHGWKFIAFGPDGKLYVPVGAPCNTCEREDPRYSSIMRMNADGSDLEVFASGVRNTVGFAWHPADQVLWFTDNGRDWLGDDLPPDELNRASRTGLHFGFPHLYGKNHRDTDYPAVDTAMFVPAALELGPHVAALGMRFYTGTMFPERYRNGIFIAEHGSWNRSKPLGYRVMFVRVENHRPVSYEIFAEGWLGNTAAWGRPVDVQQLPDGSMLVSDDKAGAIYRVTYRPS
ncbi:MAG: PQQ-dependent sugar dehydrogenase [Bacteroidetes bacterium]|nr:PQQ-dependent sugar dehydrogenase [Bacteroidota bacterium]